MDDWSSGEMRENPFAAPQAELALPPRWSGTPAQLREIARFQRGLLLCVLAFLACLAFRVVLTWAIFYAMASTPTNSSAGTVITLYLIGDALSSLVCLAALLVAAYFVFRLSSRMYSMAVAVLVTIVAIIPCLGLLMVLFINSRVTRRLRGAGYRVGLLGATLSQFDREPLF